MESSMQKVNAKGFSILLILLFIIVIVIICGVGFYTFSYQKKKNEVTRFETLAKTAHDLYMEQSKALGVVGKEEDLVKLCHQSGQGPFDNGHLQCDITVTKKIKVNPDEDQIRSLFSKFESTIKNENFVIISGGSKHAGIEGGVIQAGIYNDESKPCDLNLSYIPQTAIPDAKTTLEYRLTCAGPTSKVPAGFSYAH